jgi:hypothetical protein
MTGPEHWREAERLIEYAGSLPDGLTADEYALPVAKAQVHATLAVAAATANPLASMWQDLTP